MRHTKGMAEAWLELTRIARGELILNQIETLLSNLDLARNDEMWLTWEVLSERQGEMMRRWLEATQMTWHYENWQSAFYGLAGEALPSTIPDKNI